MMYQPLTPIQLDDLLEQVYKLEEHGEAEPGLCRTAIIKLLYDSSELKSGPVRKSIPAETKFDCPQRYVGGGGFIKT